MIEQKLVARIRAVLKGKAFDVQMHALLRVMRGLIYGEGRDKGLHAGRKAARKAKKKKP